MLGCLLGVDEMLCYGVMTGLIAFDFNFFLNLPDEGQDEVRNKDFGCAKNMRNWDLNDRDVVVFLPRLNKQSVHLIQIFVEKRRNGFTVYRQCICAKGHTIPKE